MEKTLLYAQAINWDQFITNEWVISVFVPLLVTGLAVYVNWHVDGTKMNRLNFMIGSDLVLCFTAIFLIHFFRTYRASYLKLIPNINTSHLLFWNAIIIFMTSPILFSCIGMERAAKNGDNDTVTWSHVFGNLALGAIPLMLLSLFLTV